MTIAICDAHSFIASINVVTPQGVTHSRGKKMALTRVAFWVSKSCHSGNLIALLAYMTIDMRAHQSLL